MKKCRKSKPNHHSSGTYQGIENKGVTTGHHYDYDSEEDGPHLFQNAYNSNAARISSTVAMVAMPKV